MGFMSIGVFFLVHLSSLNFVKLACSLALSNKKKLDLDVARETCFKIYKRVHTPLSLRFDD